MRCPSLVDLPPAPPGRTLWPWIADAPVLAECMPDGKPWPRITVVTPSYNQGIFIEETIRSVLLQGYPDLEYIIVDGGSSDESVAIIEKYAKWLTYWVSEKDAGQADAINKGVIHATGSWFNWINSDDLLTPGALAEVAAAGVGHNVVAGATENFAAKTVSEVIQNKHLNARGLISADQSIIFHQPSVWLSLKKLEACGGINSKFHYVFDWEMLIRYLANDAHVAYTNRVLAKFRLHDSSKTVSLPHKFEQERLMAVGELSGWPGSLEIREVARFRYRQYQWWDLIEKITNQRASGRIASASHLMAAACADPVVRFNRMTLGAVRKILFTAGSFRGG